MKHLLAAGALVALLLFLLTRNVSSDPYVYDEADYMYAASLGYFANWTDTPTISFTDFLRMGLGRGKQASGRQELSEFIRQRDDVLFYRHWHGPLYHYILIPISRLGLNEQGVRSAMLGVPALSLLTIYFGCLSLIPGAGGSIAAVLSSVLFLSSVTVFRSTELAPHQLFALCFLGCLFFLAKTVATGRRSYWYAAVVAAALAFCTLEITFALILTLAVSAYIERRTLQVGWSFIGRSVALFMATVLVIWPAAILKLSVVKAYLFMAYLALFRKAPWGNIGFFETWRGRFLASPVEWGLVALGVILFLRKRTLKENRFTYPILIYSILMLGATARVLSETARYSLPFMPAIDLFAGLTLAPFLASLRKPVGFAATALLLVGLYSTALYQGLRHARHSSQRPSAVLESIRQATLTDKTLLVPQEDLPMIHFYFHQARLRGYYTEQPAPSDFEGFPAEGILYPGYPIRLEPRRSR